MPFLTQDQVKHRVLSEATNSSHFVWLLAELKFYESSHGLLFAYTQVGKVTLIALEPLGLSGLSKTKSALVDSVILTQFNSAYQEFVAAAQIQIAAFVSINSPFLSVLSAQGFMSLKIGIEPWMNLAHCIPRGNSGKGVRAARNRAIRSGLTVEEWTGESINQEPHKQKILSEISKEWNARHLIQLEGFLNSTKILAFSETRRYFVLRSAEREEAFLIASPIRGSQSYFLEDLAQRSDAPNGTGELLTLEAMVALRDDDIAEASLGVVAISQLDRKDSLGLPPFLSLLMFTLPKLWTQFYNHAGLEIFRRRFKPERWENIYLAVKGEKASISPTSAWVQVLWALLLAFRPRFNPSWGFLRQATSKMTNRYGLTILVTSLSLLLFGFANHFGELPKEWLSKFAFFPAAPKEQWFVRSLVSDFLYFNSIHFLIWGSLFTLALSWVERTHSKLFTLSFLLSVSLLDDIVDYWVILKPFEHFHPHIFRAIEGYQEVGSSLIFMVALGIQLHQLRKWREVLFGVLSFGLVLKFALDAGHMAGFILNLDHIFFLLIGFLVGKLDYEWQRRKSQKASRGVPPVGKTINEPIRKKKALLALAPREIIP